MGQENGKSEPAVPLTNLQTEDGGDEQSEGLALPGTLDTLEAI